MKTKKLFCDIFVAFYDHLSSSCVEKKVEKPPPTPSKKNKRNEKKGLKVETKKLRWRFLSDCSVQQFSISYNSKERKSGWNSNNVTYDFKTILA